MAINTIRLTGNEVVQQGIPSGSMVPYAVGEGSLYTVVLSGTTGQTGTIEGSVDGQVWALLTTLTVGASNAPDWDVIRHSFPYLRINSLGSVAISRGN